MPGGGVILFTFAERPPALSFAPISWALPEPLQPTHWAGLWAPLPSGMRSPPKSLRCRGPWPAVWLALSVPVAPFSFDRAPHSQPSASARCCRGALQGAPSPPRALTTARASSFCVRHTVDLRVQPGQPAPHSAAPAHPPANTWLSWLVSARPACRAGCPPTPQRRPLCTQLPLHTGLAWQCAGARGGRASARRPSYWPVQTPSPDHFSSGVCVSILVSVWPAKGPGGWSRDDAQASRGHPALGCLGTSLLALSPAQAAAPVGRQGCPRGVGA